MSDHEELAVVTEVGVFGSMNIKDQSVKMVKDYEGLAKDTDNPALKKFVSEQKNKK